MSNATPPPTRSADLATSPGPEPSPGVREADGPHSGAILTGANGDDGPWAFYIHIEARLGREDDVIQMLRDIFHCVLGEPATGLLFGVRFSKAIFGIFEAFPDIAGRDGMSRAAAATSCAIPSA